ncbi:MAG: 50S ribosomal protein L9 [Alphaproteobacteria bacterium]|nr:50S ribosomal protein L9 [Alphaproteobacteria bacterium]
MEIILLERIDRLGQMGDVVNVKNGYARNYLFPQKKALRKTADNMKAFEAKRAEYEAMNAKLKADAEKLAKDLNGLSVTIIRQAAETGQLYGSVTGRDVCDAIAEKGFKVERRHVELNTPFKVMGVFDVVLKLHPDVQQTIRVNIARSEAEAQKAAQKATKAAKAEKEATAVKAVAEEAPKAEKVEEAKAEEPKAEKKAAKKPAAKKATKAKKAKDAE